jgi:hypothetical protein
MCPFSLTTDFYFELCVTVRYKHDEPQRCLLRSGTLHKEYDLVVRNGVNPTFRRNIASIFIVEQ